MLKAIGVVPNYGQKITISIDISLLGKLVGLSQTTMQSSATNQGDFNQKNTNSYQNTEQNHILVQLFDSIDGSDFQRKKFSVNLSSIIQQLNIPVTKVLQDYLTQQSTSESGLVEVPLSMLLQAVPLSPALNMEYTVIDSISSPFGKYNVALGNVIVVDSTYLIQSFKNSLYNSGLNFLFILIPTLKPQLDAFFASIRLQDYSLEIVSQFKGRYAAYESDEAPMNQDFIRVSNSIAESLGVDYPSQITFPIVLGKTAVNFIQLFLNQIFLGVTIIIGTLGTILIYTILIGKVEEKTYEYGMLRALGLSQKSLVEVILLQALYFAVPGTIIGMLLSQLVAIGVESIIVWFASIPTFDFFLAVNAIWAPILLGLTIPIIANIAPIQRAFSKQLRDALDIAHQATSETTVRMIKLAELGLEPWQTALSILLVISGFIIYYVIPYTFIFNNLPLFFLILNAILLGLLSLTRIRTLYLYL